MAASSAIPLQHNALRTPTPALLPTAVKLKWYIDDAGTVQPSINPSLNKTGIESASQNTLLDELKAESVECSDNELEAEAVEVTDNELIETLELPDCWSTNQWSYFKLKYPWLYLKTGHIGCVFCRRAKSAGKLSEFSRPKGMRFSIEWAEGKVGPSGTEKFFRQKQLRKKILEHKGSAAHLAAEEFGKAKANRTLLENVPKNSESPNTLQHLPEEDADQLPDCWNTNQWSYFKSEYQWLFLKKGCIGCCLCKEAKAACASSLIARAKGIRFSFEWAEGKIGPSGINKFFRQKQIRKKIVEHKASAAHLAADEIGKESQNPSTVETVQENTFEIPVSELYPTSEKRSLNSSKAGTVQGRKRGRPKKPRIVGDDARAIMQSKKVCLKRPRTDSNGTGAVKQSRRVCRKGPRMDNTNETRAIQNGLNSKPSPVQNLPDTEIEQLPDFWSTSQWCYFKKVYPWMFLRTGHIGCRLCRVARAARGLAVRNTPKGLRFSIEWAQGRVSPSGINKTFKQRRMRKKILEHKSSTAHLAVEKSGKGKSALRLSVSCHLEKQPFNSEGEDVMEQNRNIDPFRIHSATPDTLQPVSQAEIDQLPDCWSTKQWSYFKEEYQWLYLKNGRIGCTLCSDAKTAGGLTVYNSAMGSHFSIEWAEGKVGPSGAEKAFRQKQLRKKILEHVASAAHLAAEEINEARKNHTIVEARQQIDDKYLERTCRVFKTAYCLAKNNYPFKYHPQFIELQEANGSALGCVLRSSVTASEIIRHIAVEMQHKLVTYVTERKPKISVFLDESSTFSNKTTLIIYLRAAFGGDSKPVTIFFGLLELKETNAPFLTAALLGYFENAGISRSLLHEIWVAVCFDGADVAFSKKAGVTALLRAEFPNILLSWHCLPHHLELAVADAIDDVSATNNFKSFIDSLYSTYSGSPENKWQLEMASSDLCLQLQKLSKMFDTRWVASSYITVQAVWQSFSALYKHFEAASKDVSRSARDRRKYEGLLKKLTSCSFVTDLGLMYDALCELKVLSQALQRPDLTIIDAHRLMVRQVGVFEAMKDTPEEFATVAWKAVDEGQFMNVPLSQGGSASLNSRLFYQSLQLNIDQRCPPRCDEELIACFKVLDVENLPVGAKLVQYGELDVRKLCAAFQLPVSETIHAFKSFKDCGGQECLEELRKLVVCMEALPASLAECEKGFNTMNLIASPAKASLLITSISSCLWLMLNAPPVSAFEPLSYVKSWLAKGRRSADERHCEKPQQKKEEKEEFFLDLWKILN